MCVVGCQNGMIQIKRRRSTAANNGAWHQEDGFPTSKLPGSRPSFSASLCSPSSCFPFGERGMQDEQIAGDSMKAGLAPLLLALPAHRLARRVLRLEPRLRRPAAIGRIRPLRDDALQPHAADMIEHGRAVTRQMLSRTGWLAAWPCRAVWRAAACARSAAGRAGRQPDMGPRSDEG